MPSMFYLNYENKYLDGIFNVLQQLIIIFTIN
jgi:hypothetical protein